MSITCEVCGTVNPTGTQFCEGCGVELKPAGAPATDTSATGTSATDASSTPSASAGTVGQPDLTAPLIPPAPTIPDVPVMPAPALDTQASVPSGLEAPAATPVLDETLPADTGAGAETPAVNPDLTSTADAPLDDTISANAPVMTPAVDSPAPASDMAVPDLSQPETAVPEVSTPEGSMPAAAAGEATSAEMTGTETTGTETMGTEATGTETPVVAAAPAAPAGAAPRTGKAKLGVKKFGNATGDFIPLQGERLMVGRFDASSGPVDIDLSSLPGAEHISRHHAELYREGGQWFVRDLGSTNGVFVRQGGQSAFSPRLQEPTALKDGDELAFGNLMLTFHQD